MYYRDIELTERFARENPSVIARARKNLMACTVMYRCENFHIYFPGKARLGGQWLATADEDLKAAKALLSLQASFFSTIGFHCQEAVEKYFSGRDFSDLCWG